MADFQLIGRKSNRRRQIA